MIAEKQILPTSSRVVEEDRNTPSIGQTEKKTTNAPHGEPVKSRIKEDIVKNVSDRNLFWETLSEFSTQDGRDLLELTHEKPVLLIFLRHLGCTFCRETLADVSSRKESLAKKGILPVFVHMSQDDEDMRTLLGKYGIEDCLRISDPQKTLYQTFGLKRGTISQVLGPKVMWRGLMSSILKGHGFGMPNGDPLQLPGIFLLHRGRILKDFRHELSSDKPPYGQFEECEGC